MIKKINFGTIAPSFMIIGVQKAGTSSLYYYLSQHPQLLVPKTKELHFFDTQDDTPTKEYHKLFPKSYGINKLSFEATPRYIYYPGTAKKIYDYNPNMKFIVMLRNPVDRAYSAWNMYREMAKDQVQLKKFLDREKLNKHDAIYSHLYKYTFPTFEEWVKKELSHNFSKKTLEPSIVKRGFYKEQIETYFKFFPKKSFLFLDFDEFKEHTVTKINDVTAFLNISKFKKVNIDLKPKNKRIYLKEIKNETYKKLLLHYQEKNKGLDNLTGLDLRWL